uniref:SH2 domain-containing protein n=1 Tax=Macrostomum lignano TaxID=282301 RepID=A0A1I8F1B4_9PLAT
MRDMLVQKMIGQTRAGVHPGGGGGGGSGVSSINHQLIRPPSAASSDAAAAVWCRRLRQQSRRHRRRRRAAVATVPGKEPVLVCYALHWRSEGSASRFHVEQGRRHGFFMVRVTPGSSEDSGGRICSRDAGLQGPQPALDHLQFWEDAFLDAVATERDIKTRRHCRTGTPPFSGRYESLGRAERKRLELDEDRLLCTMLYNLTAFMVMMRVDPAELRKKIRRLLGKSHIGCTTASRSTRCSTTPAECRATTSSHSPCTAARTKTGDLRFLEVCDDCLILRACSGAIVDRWWYEKLVNMTFCPKTRVLILWRRDAAAAGQQPQADSTRAPAVKNVFYSKRCRDVYSCIRDQMARAAARTARRSDATGQTGEFGGRYEVVESASGEHGILQVCMQGIGLAFDSTKIQ